MRERAFASAATVALAIGVSALVATGCGEPASGFATMGMPGVPSPARIGANLVLAEVLVDGHEGPLMLVDTGSPFTLIDPTSYPDVTFPDVAEIKVDLTFGAFTVDNVPAIQTTFIGDGSFSVPEIVGGNLMRQFQVQIDYSERDPSRAFQLGAGMQAPAGVETPGATVSFKLEGGGRGKISEGTNTVVVIPATRIPLSVDIEGVSHPMILDTGASEVTVRDTVYGALTADQRAQLTGLPIGTAMGQTTARVTRARTVTVGGQVVNNVPVMTIGDKLLDNLEGEIGHPIDGLLGGSYLREFLVTIDYPKGQLRLQRYDPPLPIVDEFERIGVEIEPGSGAHRYSVATVYPGTDAAAKRISVGDEIVSIDGRSLDTLDAIDADESLDGVVGSVKKVELGAAAVPDLANTVLDVLVDELIPPP